MWNYIWPLGLVIVSNTVYHLCTKESPANVSPFATLTVTYLIGAIVCAILNFVLNPGESLWKDITKMNWAPFVLGIVIVGLETGWIYAYKAGWQVSEGYIVQSAILAIVLLLIGYILYREALTWNKILGIVICLVGLVFINMK